MTTIKGTLNVDEAVTLDTTLDVTGDTRCKKLDSPGATAIASAGVEVYNSILNYDYQIYVIQTIYYSQPVPIASLNTRLGGNVVSANFCQALVAIKSGYISYIRNETLFNKCSEQGNN